MNNKNIEKIIDEFEEEFGFFLISKLWFIPVQKFIIRILTSYRQSCRKEMVDEIIRELPKEKDLAYYLKDKEWFLGEGHNGYRQEIINLLNNKK